MPTSAGSFLAVKDASLARTHFSRVQGILSVSRKLYVGNLTYDTTEDDLVELFQTSGEVVSAQIIIDRETNRSRGFGFGEMSSGAEQAIESLNGQDFRGRNFTVNKARPRDPRESRGGSGYRGGGGYGCGGGGGGRGGYGGDRY